jgi:hypothetical protein
VGSPVRSARQHNERVDAQLVEPASEGAHIDVRWVSDEVTVGRFRDAHTGPVLSPSDDGYDGARRVYNGLIDKSPALIARARSAPDVAAAIGFAREVGLEISVRGGGHGVAGRAVSDGGLMIDLSLMKAIEVKTDRRTARVGGGVTWGEFNDATAVHGLATTGGVVSTTGIAGLTLGGGFGFLMGKHGMAADNLLSVEVVTASGEVVTASAEDHPDVLGAARCRRELRRGDVARVPAPSGVAGRGRHRRVSLRGLEGLPRLLPQVHGGTPG